MLRALKVHKPDILLVMGDFADGESLSLHEPDEPGKRDFEDELGCVLRALTQLDELGAARKIYLEGNHEQRLSRYLARRAPALYRSLALPELLKLKDRGWEWVPYRQSIKVGKLHLTHDTGSAGMNAHRSSAKAFMGSAVIGHTHRMAYEVAGRFDESPYVAAMFGWLGDAKSAARYIHEAKSAEWVHGFGVGYMEQGTGIVHLQPVPIINGTCCVAGKLIT
jgi:predicted phosphodiesterase